jgi:HAE1 family hydrophobic/amphiphilic exporter-1
VALDDIAQFTAGTAPSDISRLGRQRQVTVFANVLPSASQAEVQNAILKAFEPLRPGPAYNGSFTGRSRELGRAAENFVIAFVLSLVFMYLVLAAQFESWLHPITILLALPMTIPFALLAIVMFNQSINIYSALGIMDNATQKHVPSCWARARLTFCGSFTNILEALDSGPQAGIP